MHHAPTFGRLFLAVLFTLTISCDENPDPPGESSDVPAEPEHRASKPADVDVWWDHLNALCDKAFAGKLTSEDPADAAFAGQSMTMHVRRCEPERLEIPFHVGENRSRTWVLTRTEQGLRLRHDHRHQDGSEDVVTLYGGYAESPGTQIVQSFPADDYSQRLFVDNELNASVDNVWSMEVVPGERFSYILRRPERHFQVDFDLGHAVDPPPAPWGHE